MERSNSRITRNDDHFAFAAVCARRALVALVAANMVLLIAGTSLAQSSQWAVEMFGAMGTERMHNFGSVALHADVEKRFAFKNIYDEDVVISSVSSNCGCTKATVSKNVVRPGEIAEVIARVDTSGREHTKQRKATIRVVFSQPSVAEVQLQVKTYIRPDVGFEPGTIDFGTVQRGARVVKKAFLQYEGRPDWALVSVQKTNPGVRAEAREVRRRGGSVVYEIDVELKSDAEPGYISDQLRFQTNDRDSTTSSIFLPLQGLVVEPLCATPARLQFGVAAPGKRVVKNLVVSGSEPFKILGVKSKDPRLSFQKTDLSRSVHVVPVAFDADDEIGEFSATVVVSTNQRDENGELQKITVQTSGYIADPDAAAEIAGRARKRDVQNDANNLGVPQASEEIAPKPLETSASKSSRRVAPAPQTQRALPSLPSLVPAQEQPDATRLAPYASARLELVNDDDKNEEKIEGGWVAIESKSDIKSARPNARAHNQWISNWKEGAPRNASANAQQRENDSPERVAQTPNDAGWK